MTSLFTDNRSSRLLVVESVVDHSLVHSTLQNRQFSRTEREARYTIAERKTSLSFSSLLLSRALRSGIVFRSREYPSDNFEGFSLRPKTIVISRSFENPSFANQRLFQLLEAVVWTKKTSERNGLRGRK